MIAKGNQRGGGQQLATHLLNAVDNDRVEVMDLRGSIANDLHGAFAEWAATATATKCKKYIYSLSINPDPQQHPLSHDDYKDFIQRAEKKLGLDQQPRAIVFHVKNGREHCHVIWSRIDTEKIRAVQLSNDRYKLRSAVREFTLEKGLELPIGMKHDLVDRFNDRAALPTLAEKQQEERTGIPKDQRRRDITQAWKTTNTGKEFITALGKAGYALAQGDKRGYVVVDRFGEIHSLSRQIEGARTKNIKARLAGFPSEKLPSAKEAQKYLRQKDSPRLKEEFQTKADERRLLLDKAQKARGAALEKQKADLAKRHPTERKALKKIQKERDAKIKGQRKKAEPTGLAGFLSRVSGHLKRRKSRHKKEDAQRHEARCISMAALTRRQEREIRNLSRQYRALGKIEKREIRSLETKIKRELLNARKAKPEYTLSPQQQAKTQEFNETAQDIPQPIEPAKTGLSDAFAQKIKDRAAKREQKQDRSKRRSRGPRLG